MCVDGSKTTTHLQHASPHEKLVGMTRGRPNLFDVVGQRAALCILHDDENTLRPTSRLVQEARAELDQILILDRRH
jgi:hypothetical protein